ncbi:MAG: hypothetical protein S4CHLAM37_00970 [Chlamydiia bacterium]|nr:hypothetical protein [Chlamydiia bacterium]
MMIRFCVSSFKRILLAASFLLGSFIFSATDTATEVLNLQINAINEIAITGSVGTLAITDATPGLTLFSVTSSSINYAYTSNDGKSKKVMGSIDIIMPSSTTLYANASAPASGGLSLGEVALGTLDINLVTGIPANTKDTGVSLYYKFEASTQAGTISEFSRTVTLTLLDN